MAFGDPVSTLSSVRSEVSSASEVLLVEASDASAIEAQYQDESFEEEDSASLVPKGESEESGSGGGRDDEDAYNDDVFDAFEDELATLQDDYSADAFEGQDDDDEEARVCEEEVEMHANKEPDAPQEDEPDFSSYGGESFEAEAADDEAIDMIDAEFQAGDQELEPAAPDEVYAVNLQAIKDLPTLMLGHQWYSEKIKTLSTGNAHRGLAVQSPKAIFHTIPTEACHALRQQLLQKSQQLPSAVECRRDRWMRRSEKHALEASLPIEFIDKLLCNANTKRLLHTSESDPDVAKTLPPPQRRHLDTFCTVKRADLEGKLATSRFEAQWARTCTTHASKTGEMSIGTLTLVQDMMAAQRKILQSSSAACAGTGVTLFSCMQTRAPCLDLTVESTKRCLEESRLLREQAAKVLRPRGDIHTATAN